VRRARVPRAVVVLASCAIGLAAVPLMAEPAHAVDCPPSTVGGPTVARISLGDVVVPVKNVSYTNGGVLRPPPTNKAAGLSTVNTPLGASEGTTVLAWHVRYGPGCYGLLNPLLTKPIGSTFKVGRVGKPMRTYAITKRVTVPRGQYRWEWFRVDGPYRLALFTCTGYRDGVFRNTTVVFASPVPVRTPSAASAALDPRGLA